MKNNKLKWVNLLILNGSMDLTLDLTGITWHKWSLLYGNPTLMMLITEGNEEKVGFSRR